ncbi:MAG: cyclic lactone autoinducer peptide [Peptoanaerobacter stomatis]
MRNKMIKIINKTVCMGALFFAFVSANTSCVFVFHQPKMPEKIKKLRRF